MHDVQSEANQCGVDVRVQRLQDGVCGSLNAHEMIPERLQLVITETSIRYSDIQIIDRVDGDKSTPELGIVAVTGGQNSGKHSLCMRHVGFHG
jgi:hypothetical protein